MTFAPWCCLWPCFCRSFPWLQLCGISENARWGFPFQIWHSLASRALWEPRFAAKCCASLALQGNYNYDMMAFAPRCFMWPYFCRRFPWSQLCRISENARWGSPWQIWHSSASRALWEPRFPAKCFARLTLQGNHNYDRMTFAPGCFLWPSFFRTFPWSELCGILENARWGSPCQICHSWAMRALWEPQFAAKCCAMLAL